MFMTLDSRYPTFWKKLFPIKRRRRRLLLCLRSRKMMPFVPEFYVNSLYVISTEYL
jgi:hypothetical protein